MNGQLIETSNHKCSVEIESIAAGLVVKNAESKQVIFTIAASQVEFQLGGNNKNLLFIQSSLLAGRVVYVDATSENINYFNTTGAFTLQLEKIKKEKNQMLRISAYFFIGIILLFAVLFQYRGAIATQLTFLIPFSVEKKIGDKIFKPKLTEEQLKVVQQLSDLGQELKFETKIWPHQFTFHISSETTPNAYATVGGHVFVHKGLILAVDRSEDLLGVIAHELIHVQRRHVAKSMVQAIGVYGILTFLAGDVTGIAAVLVDQGAPLLNLSYSRELEDEADRLGMQLLNNNQIDPSGLAFSLQKINDYQKKLTSQSPTGEIIEKLQRIEILNSHPEIEKRIKDLKTKSDGLKASQTYKVLNFDYAKFKEIVKSEF